MKQLPTRGVMKKEEELHLCRMRAKEYRMIANKLKLDYNKWTNEADAMEEYCLDLEEQIIHQKGWVE